MRGTYKVALLSFVNLFSQAFSILSGIFLVRFYSPEDYGTYRQVFLIVLTCSYIFSAGIPASLLYFFPNMSKQEKKGILIQTIIILLILGVLGSFLVFFFTPLISDKFSNPAINTILPFFSFYILFYVLIQYIQGMFMGLDQYKNVTISQIVIQLSTPVIVVASILLDAGIYRIMQLLFIYMVIQTLVIVYISLHIFRDVETQWKKSDILKQLRFSLPLGMSGIVWFVGKEIDKCCLALLFTPAVYAIYVVGALEIPTLAELNTTISSVLLPKMSALREQNKTDQIVSLWKETIRKSMLIFFPAFWILFLVAQPLIVTLYTNQYIESVAVFKIYLCLLCLRITGHNVILQAYGKTKIILVSSVIFIILNISLNILFLKVLKTGITGPAIATLISYVVLTVFGVMASLYYMKRSFIEIFPLKEFIKITLISIGAYSIPIYLFSSVQSYLIKGIVSGATFASLYLFMGWYFKIFTYDDIFLIFKFIRKDDSMSARL